MLLNHQAFATFTKSQKYFCVQWQNVIQRSQTLLSFDLKILLWGFLTASLGIRVI